MTTPASPTRLGLIEYRAILATGQVRGVKKRRYASAEENLHRSCFEWVTLNRARHPLLAWLIHIPNGGRRPRGEAGKLKALGVKKGVPDFVLPFPSPNARWSGFAVELKSPTGRLSQEQQDWLAKMVSHGWMTGVARNLDEFIDLVGRYLRG